MSDDVVAVLDPLLRHRPACGGQPWNVALERPQGCTCGARDRALAALTAAGKAIVDVPEGVAVAHGARLVDSEWKAHKRVIVPGGWTEYRRPHDKNSVHMDGCTPLYAIEDAS